MSPRMWMAKSTATCLTRVRIGLQCPATALALALLLPFPCSNPRLPHTASARHALLATHTCPAYALAWGHNLVVAGPDKRVIVLNDAGRIAQQFDHSSEPGEREPSLAIASPSGQSVVIGSYDWYVAKLGY